MKSSSYWRKRELEKLELVDILANEQVEKMNSLIDKVVRNIDTEIAKLYLKYSKDNGISYQDALIYLKDNERKEFQKDLKYYIETCRDKNKLDKYRQELQALSTRARVKRLEVLQAKIRMSATDIEGFLKNDTTNVFKDIYSESYLHSMFSLEGAKGIEVKFNMPNTDKVNKLLEHPWSGKNYSSKIWDTTGNFVNKMESIVTTGLIQGKPYNVIAKELELAKIGKDGTGGQRYQIERLIRTEAAFIAEQATRDNYIRDGIEEYEYSATLDLRTSNICSGLDGKEFKVKDAITGVNYPPMHPNCRSTTVPVVKWEGEEDDKDERIYRDALTGKNYYAKVKDYTEWKDMQYEKYGEEKVNAEQKKIRNRASDKLQFERYTSILGKNKLPKSFDEFQDMKYNKIKEWGLLKEKVSVDRNNQLHAISRYISSDSYKINDKLRNNLELTNEDKEFINSLDKALDAMPTFSGDLTRSLEFMYKEDLEKFLNRHKPGEEITYDEYISTTKGSIYNPDGDVQIYILNSQKGKDITKYNNGEQEILYARGSKFEVVEIDKIGKVIHILLKEV